MSMVRPFTRSELAAMYPDAEWRRKLLELLSLVAILRECIIENNYKPSEKLTSAITLNDAGTKLMTQLITKESVNARDAKLLTLLALVHIDPFVDIAGIDLERLREAISDEMLSGALKYPEIFGRTLYDRAAIMFREEREYLNHEDTLKLLDDTSQGVYQSGHYLLGPFGIFRRDFHRRLGPTTSIPLQHCADSGCAAVHRVQLSTSIEAGVNRSRPALHKVLELMSEEPSEWNGFISDLSELDSNSYELSDSATLAHLIGDAFSDHELIALIVYSSTHGRGALQEAVRAFGLQGRVDEIAVDLERGQALQLLFMLDDDELARLVDGAVRESIIIIPKDEVRRPKINGRARSSAWGLRSQVSRLGTRQVGSDRALPVLRLSALARSLFDIGSNEEMEDLAWILRAAIGDTSHEKLEEFLRVTEPAEIIEVLILSRKASATKVCNVLRIPMDQDDQMLRDSILWKLGFPLPRSRDFRDEYWFLHDRLESLAKTANVDITSTAAGLRATASDYFVSLEHFLFDALSFATWALLYDHFDSDEPFVFFEDVAVQFTIETLNESVQIEDDGLALSAEPLLSQLVEGFTRLSKKLDSLRSAEASYLRSESGFPKFSSKTDLQKFPFLHTHPYLDLVPDSQLNLVRVIAEVGSGLGQSGIMTARNGLLHSKQVVPTIGEVTEALDRSRKALDQLESIGCVRNTYALSIAHSDAWGRVTTTLRSMNRSISFSSPSAYEWVRLPALSRPHYLVQGAVFAAPNEMLRFAEGFTSEYQDYWAKFPVRPEPGNKILASQSETLATQTETGSYAGALSS